MERLVQRLYEVGAVRKGSFILKGGNQSRIYFDIKKACGYPDILNPLVDGLWELVENSPTCVAAEGYGGMVLASVMSSRYNIRLSLVRKTPKDHGTMNLIEGYRPTEIDRVIIVDDVSTTFGTLNEVRRIVKDTTGARVVGNYVVVNRGRTDVDFVKWLFTEEQILKYAMPTV